MTGFYRPPSRRTVTENGHTYVTQSRCRYVLFSGAERGRKIVKRSNSLKVLRDEYRKGWGKDAVVVDFVEGRVIRPNWAYPWE